MQKESIAAAVQAAIEAAKLVVTQAAFKRALETDADPAILAEARALAEEKERRAALADRKRLEFQEEMQQIELRAARQKVEMMRWNSLENKLMN